jgi:hypothetical protein
VDRNNTALLIRRRFVFARRDNRSAIFHRESLEMLLGCEVGFMQSTDLISVQWLHPGPHTKFFLFSIPAGDSSFDHIERSQRRLIPIKVRL